MKSKKKIDLGVWGIETTFGPSWAQKTCQAISPEPWFQFPQTGAHFLKNHEINPVRS